MPIALLPDRQYAAPASADGVEIVLPGVAWDDSDIAVLEEETDSAWILTGIVARPIGLLFTGYVFQVDVLVGDEDAEVPIATFHGTLHEVFATVGSEGLRFDTILGIDLIPLGSRVSTRWRANTTETTALRVSMSYLKKPLSGTLLTTTQPLLCVPAEQMFTSATPWLEGTPVEFLDDSGPARAIVGMNMHVAHAALEWEVDICTGPSDAVVTTVRGSRGGVSSYPNNIAFPNPLVIPALTRVSMQARSQDASVITVGAAFSYCELPL